MTALDTRIDTMHKTGLLSDSAHEKIGLLRRLLLDMFGLKLTEENASGFITHFGMALMRIERGEDIAPLDPLVREDVEDEDDYHAARIIAQEIFDNVSPLTVNEQDYIIVHVLVVLSAIRKEYDQSVISSI